MAEFIKHEEAVYFSEAELMAQLRENKGIPKVGARYFVSFDKKRHGDPRVSVKLTEPKGAFNVIAESWEPEPGIEYEVALERGSGSASKAYYGQWICLPVNASRDVARKAYMDRMMEQQRAHLESLRAGREKNESKK